MRACVGSVRVHCSPCLLQAELYALIDGQEVKTIVSTSDLSVTEGKVSKTAVSAMKESNLNNLELHTATMVH